MLSQYLKSFGENRFGAARGKEEEAENPIAE